MNSVEKRVSISLMRTREQRLWNLQRSFKRGTKFKATYRSEREQSDIQMVLGTNVKTATSMSTLITKER